MLKCELNSIIDKNSNEKNFLLSAGMNLVNLVEFGDRLEYHEKNFLI
jgi:hypothetical protein